MLYIYICHATICYELYFVRRAAPPRRAARRAHTLLTPAKDICVTTPRPATQQMLMPYIMSRRAAATMFTPLLLRVIAAWRRASCRRQRQRAHRHAARLRGAAFQLRHAVRRAAALFCFAPSSSSVNKTRLRATTAHVAQPAAPPAASAAPAPARRAFVLR